jgi:hypothetical protein
MDDLEKEARELLAAEMDREGAVVVAGWVREGTETPPVHGAIRALVSVLSDLREAEKVVRLGKDYADRFLMDEYDSPQYCVNPEQHEKVCAFVDGTDAFLSKLREKSQGRAG